MKIALFLIALPMMAVGGLVVLDGLFSGVADETVYQQIAGRVAMTGGVCLFGFGFLVVALLCLLAPPKR